MLKKSIKKYCAIYIALFVFLVVLVPMFLNVLMKINSGVFWMQAEWSADSVLNYYGGLLSATLAVGGVYATLKDSKEKHKEEQRNAVLPHLAFTRLTAQFSHPFEAAFAYHGITEKRETPDNNQYSYKGYWETKLQELWIQIDDGRILFQQDLTPKQKEKFQYSNYVENQGLKLDDCVIPMCIPFVLKNVGIGAAISVRIALQRRGVEREDATPCMSLSMSPNDEFTLHIFAERMTKYNDIWGEYELIVQYNNIFGDLYRQKCSINMEYRDNNSAVVVVKMIQGQELIKYGGETK